MYEMFKGQKNPGVEDAFQIDCHLTLFFRGEGGLSPPVSHCVAEAPTDIDELDMLGVPRGLLRPVV